MGSYISIPTYVRSLPQRYRLRGSKCNACGTVHFPGTGRCRQCGRHDDFQPHPLPRQGKIATFTVIEPGGAPSEFADQVRNNGPYAVALVEMEGGVRVLGQVTDTEPYQLRIGDTVEVVLRILYQQEGIIRYSFKFRPLLNGSDRTE